MQVDAKIHFTRSHDPGENDYSNKCRGAGGEIAAIAFGAMIWLPANPYIGKEMDIGGLRVVIVGKGDEHWYVKRAQPPTDAIDGRAE